MKKLAIVILGTLVTACSTSPNVVQKADNYIEIYGAIDGRQIGLNKDREIIIQEELSIQSELKVQELHNYEKEQGLDYKKAALMQCREELASPTLGGNGTVIELPDVDNMRATPAIQEQIGITKAGQLNVIKREYFLERLKLERVYGETLGKMLQTVSKFNDRCQREMKVARVKHGFPMNRYSGAGHFTPEGNWVTEQQAEHSLDDAIAIRNQLTKSGEIK